MASPTAGSPSALRSFNQARILHLIRASTAVSRVDLARQTGLSKPTVGKIVADLVDVGLVEEVSAPDGDVTRRAGPRPKLVAFRPDFGFVIGVDIGGNKLLLALADLAGNVVATRRVSASRLRRARAIIRELEVQIPLLLEGSRVSARQVVCVSVGTPGVVDPTTSRVTLAPQIAGWDRVDIVAEVSAILPTRVLVDTEVQLSLLAERWKGAGRGVDDLVYVNVGIGIAAGILLGGVRHRGASGAAGEIGYMPLFVEDGEGVDPSDELGSFERAAGGSAYARLGRAAARKAQGGRLLELAGGDPRDVEAETVFRAAADGDPAALEIVDELVDRLARGVAAVASVIDPALVIIGGGLSRAGPPLLDRLDRGVTHYLPRPPRLVLSELGEEAVALGAVRAAITDWENRAYAGAIRMR